MASSGMGSAEIRSLKYKHFINSIEEVSKELTLEEKLDIFKLQSIMQDKRIFGTWHIIRQKTSIPYVTFSTPESIQAIIDYLINQIHCNKPIRSLDDYLFKVKWQEIEKTVP